MGRNLDRFANHSHKLLRLSFQRSSRSIVSGNENRALHHYYCCHQTYGVEVSWASAQVTSITIFGWLLYHVLHPIFACIDRDLHHHTPSLIISKLDLLSDADHLPREESGGNSWPGPFVQTRTWFCSPEPSYRNRPGSSHYHMSHIGTCTYTVSV